MRKFIISGLSALSLFITGLAGAAPAHAIQITDGWKFQSGNTQIEHGAGVKGSVGDLLGIGNLFK
jgi:hypothetical protein